MAKSNLQLTSNFQKVKLDQTMEKLKTNYKPATFTIMNNGHTVQANDATGSNFIIIESEKYKRM
ncbi:hypothetical protein [Fictibacillus gelatini]|uniref:hypothetical protein n=1 Tax=Fictibacillus gelatini TaxID=225985 RepID=UPI000426A710|nr:hypothetical protein [Fictibacillus gelatini]